MGRVAKSNIERLGTIYCCCFIQILPRWNYIYEIQSGIVHYTRVLGTSSYEVRFEASCSVSVTPRYSGNTLQERAGAQ